MPKISRKAFLKPGEIVFAKAPFVVSTLLGSCVSATIWHPHRLIGGMCHILLPEQTIEGQDTKYAESAVEYFLSNILLCDTLPCEYELRIYGGGNMFPHIKKPAKSDVGNRNIRMMRYFLQKVGFILRKGMDDVGGENYRRLTLNVTTGEVNLNSNKVEQSCWPLKGSGNV